MKNIFKSLAIVAVAIFAGYNVSQSNNETEGMSDTMLAKVEALAGMEGGGTQQQCYQVYTSADWFHADQVFVDCYDCKQKKGRNFDVSRFCYN